MWNTVKLPVIPWIYFVGVPFHCSLVCHSVKKANHKQQKKLCTWRCTTSLPHTPVILYGTVGVPAFVYKKSCGNQLFWDALDIICAENYFDNWNLLKWKTTETWDNSSMELPLLSFFLREGKGVPDFDLTTFLPPDSPCVFMQFHVWRLDYNFWCSWNIPHLTKSLGGGRKACENLEEQRLQEPSSLTCVCPGWSLQGFQTLRLSIFVKKK